MRPKIHSKPRSLREVISELPESSIRNSLIAWMDSFDLSRVRSFKDIAEGYKGVSQLILFTGHSSPEALRTCEVLLKCLAGYREAYKDFLHSEFPEDIKKFIEEEFRKLKDAMRKTLSPEDYHRIERVLAFGGDEK